jgi:hypothetical protein
VKELGHLLALYRQYAIKETINDTNMERPRKNSTMKSTNFSQTRIV